jgi:hypothetical protein
MLNHDFKGTVLNLQAKVAQLDDTNDALSADLTHIHQSLMSIPYRCKQTSETQGRTRHSALSAVMETLGHLFPQAIICSLDLDVAFVPCLLLLVLYQLSEGDPQNVLNFGPLQIRFSSDIMLHIRALNALVPRGSDLTAQN